MRAYFLSVVVAGATLTLCDSLPVVGDSAVGIAPPDADFGLAVTYYQGHWTCSGHFANGKAVDSEEAFEPWLDGSWLHETHDDLPPFTFHAHSIWGIVKPSNILTLTIHDNFGGERMFTSHSWHGPSITFDAQPILGTPVKQERFIYVRKPPTEFSFEYQVATGANGWHLGDHVDCKKRP